MFIRPEGVDPIFGSGPLFMVDPHGVQTRLAALANDFNIPFLGTASERPEVYFTTTEDGLMALHRMEF